MAQDRVRAGQKKPTMQSARMQETPAAAERSPIQEQAPLANLQKTVGNQAVQSLLASGRIDHLKGRVPGHLPSVRGVLQTQRQTEEEEELTESDEEREAAGVKSPAGELPPADPPPAQSALTVRRAGSARIQRALNDEQKKIWDQYDGDKIIADLKKEVDAWKEWRKQPITYEGMPKGDGVNLNSLNEMVRLNGQVFAQHAASELGGEAVKYLTEMAAFVTKFNMLTGGTIPGVAVVKPNHKYEMRAIESENLMMKSWPIGELEVIYTNAFGWTWVKKLKGTFMSVEVAIGRTNKGVKGGLDFNIPGQISINGKATAKHTAYWGLDDLPGPVHVVNGPSVKGTVAGFGSKVASGGGIQFVGTGGAPLSPLNFENFATEFNLDPETPKKPDDLKEAQISISIIEQGAGAVWGAGGDSFAIPEPEPQAVQSEKTWKYNIGPFATGSAELPGDTQTYLNMIKQDVDAKKQEIDAQAEIFAQLGVDPDFKVEFMIEGYASRPWQTAGNDAQRREKNKQLSQARADAVASQVSGMFADVLGGITAVGRGAAVRLVEHDIRIEGGEVVKSKTTEKLLTEEENGDQIEAEIKKREEQYRKDFPWMTEQEIKKRVRASLGTSSEADDPFIRRVVVTAMWRGYEIRWGGANSTPVPTPRGN
jgi:hypothetical protein